MIVKRDSEMPARLGDPAGKGQILLARLGFAAGMIVHQNQADGLNVQRAVEDHSRGDPNPRGVALCDQFIGKKPVAGIEEQHPQSLGATVGEGGDQIAFEILATRLDRCLEQAIAQAIVEQSAMGIQKADDLP